MITYETLWVFLKQDIQQWIKHYETKDPLIHADKREILQIIAEEMNRYEEILNKQGGGQWKKKS